MQKNVASQTAFFFAFDSATGLPKISDGANILAYVSKDAGTVTVIAAASGVPTEVDSTNAKGYYKIALAQGETNADILLFSGKSSTSNIVVVGAPARVATVPPNFNLTSLDASGRVDLGKILGTTSAGAAGYVAHDMAQAISSTQSASTVGEAFLLALNRLGRRGTAQAGGASTITLDSGASAVDNIYATHNIKIIGGTGAGQVATIASYVGSTKVATITRPGGGTWTTNPDNTSIFQIEAVPLSAVGFFLFTVLTETAGQIAAAFIKFFNKATPTGTVNSLPDAVAGAASGLALVGSNMGTVTTAANLTNAPTAGDFTAAMKTSLNAATPASVQNISAQTGDAFARLGAAGVGLTNLGDTRIAHLDADVSSRTKPADTQAAVTLVTTTTTLTNAPPDSSGTTTLLSRLPAGLFTGLTNFAQWLGAIAGKQVGNSTARTEMRATGAGSGTFDETTDSQEALRDRGDAAWITATGFSTLTAAQVRDVDNTSPAAGSLGAKVNSAASAGDPWNTALPGSYGAGTAGKIVGDNINATVSSRMATYTQPTGFLAASFPTDPADASDISTALSALQTAILAKLPAALTSDGNIKADALRVGGTLQTGGDLAALLAVLAAYPAATVISGTVGSATTPSTTQFTPSALGITVADANQLSGRVIIFLNGTTTGGLKGQANTIMSNAAAALPLITLGDPETSTTVPLTRAPAAGDVFYIL